MILSFFILILIFFRNLIANIPVIYNTYVTFNQTLIVKCLTPTQNLSLFINQNFICNIQSLSCDVTNANAIIQRLTNRYKVTVITMDVFVVSCKLDNSDLFQINVIPVKRHFSISKAYVNWRYLCNDQYFNSELKTNSGCNLFSSSNCEIPVNTNKLTCKTLHYESPLLFRFLDKPKFRINKKTKFEIECSSGNILNGRERICYNSICNVYGYNLNSGNKYLISSDGLSPTKKYIYCDSTILFEYVFEKFIDSQNSVDLLGLCDGFLVSIYSGGPNENPCGIHIGYLMDDICKSYGLKIVGMKLYFEKMSPYRITCKYSNVVLTMFYRNGNKFSEVYLMILLNIFSILIGTYIFSKINKIK